MKYEKKQDEEIASLGDEEWPLWSKKWGTQTWEIRHGGKLIHQVCMEI